MTTIRVRIDAHPQQRVTRVLAVRDDPVGMPQREAHGLVLAAPSPGRELLAVRIDDHRPKRESRHRPRHQSFGQRPEGVDGIEAMGQRRATATS